METDWNRLFADNKMASPASELRPVILVTSENSSEASRITVSGKSQRTDGEDTPRDTPRDYPRVTLGALNLLRENRPFHGLVGGRQIRMAKFTVNPGVNVWCPIIFGGLID